ncbi:Septum site-determining protein [gamma proteobacterium HdN1]|nr:Septum site-determining protein [gamma proteobacterium HdN1]
MHSTDTAVEEDLCFKLKGSRVTMTILELYHYNYNTFTRQLAETVQAAPDFFQETPVLVSLDKCGDNNVDFIELGELCREHGLVPVAIRGGNDTQMISANVAGLPRLPAAANPTALDVPDTSVKTVVQRVEVPVPAVNKIITTPIRSGQQVYAANADLIVLAPVSPGAEILADGNIHVYGPLRGRALAGVGGNTAARIFCQSQEAELLSIAGIYTVSEDLRNQHYQQPAQACLDGNQIVISPLVSGK